MTFRLAWLCGLLLMAQAAAAVAAVPSPKLSCSLFGWKNVEHFDSLSAMQPRVVQFLLDRLAAQSNAPDRSALMAERDADWQATEPMPGAARPARRFINGLKFGNRWFVWYERSAKTPSTHLVAYDFTPSSPAPILVGHLIPASPDDLCPVTRAMLTARLLPRGGLDSGSW